MSIMALSGRHYGSVAKFLIEFTNDRDHSWVKYNIADWYQVNVNHVDIDATIREAVLDWQRLNYNAYNDKYQEDIKIEDEPWENPVSMNPYEAVSALRSIDYQIEEEHIENTYSNRESLDILSRFTGMICEFIVSRSPEYERTSMNTHSID